MADHREDTIMGHDYPRTVCIRCGDVVTGPTTMGPCSDESNGRRPHLPEPRVGLPATVHLPSDAYPVIVTKVNAKSVTVRRIAVDESTRVATNGAELAAGGFPAYAWQGDPSRPLESDSERYSLIAPGVYRNGSISLTLGRAVKVTDYRY